MQMALLHIICFCHVNKTIEVTDVFFPLYMYNTMINITIFFSVAIERR